MCSFTIAYSCLIIYQSADIILKMIEQRDEESTETGELESFDSI